MIQAMQLLDDFLELRRKIFDYFGYVEDWRVLPLDDRRGHHWMLMQHSTGSGEVAWSPEPFTEEAIEAGQAVFSAAIYTQRHLPKWVYRGPEHTMVVVDTNTDGNQLLMIFDNSLECADEYLKETWAECW